jgi:hypothetical protein
LEWLANRLVFDAEERSRIPSPESFTITHNLKTNSQIPIAKRRGSDDGISASPQDNCDRGEVNNTTGFLSDALKDWLD